MKWDLIEINEGDTVLINFLNGDEVNIKVRDICLTDVDNKEIFIIAQNNTSVLLYKNDVSTVTVNA